MDERGGSGVHRGGGGRRHKVKARHSIYHTENRGTSSYIHPPGRPPGPLVAAPEVARDTDRSSDYRTVTVPSVGASPGGGNGVVALPTSLPVDATQCPTPPQQLL